MKIGGIDIGSRYIKYVILEGNHLIEFQKRETGHNPLSVCRKLIDNCKTGKLVATGYGRHLLEVHGNVKTITEIKAVAKGAREVFPRCQTIIDIGGQDTKIISLREDGTVTNFEMNDRCAAGTGRFLEIMAKVLGYDLENFGDYCNNKNGTVKINSLCTVFAESEVISLITKGEKREVVAHALHESIVSRVIALIKRVEVRDDIVFAGGCAKNSCLKRMIEERLQKEIHVHNNPYMHAAHGAALYAMEM
ncbi:MAG: acyl-CoA dehydratase activase [Nitrospirota bacterium]